MSNDGRVLVLASTDGYCSIINFSDVELGVAYVPPVPKGLEEQDLVAMEVEKNVEPITVKEPLMVAPAATVNVLHAGLIKKKILPVASQAMDCGDTDNMENKTTLSNSLK
ncbi:hypothetical protein BC830DRAFT_204697 [Chytriomyces sp. MP71]|nr:hypothetical protein BC830DRAFT_204697 [Chytriomyces sp. MP71]